MHKWQKHLSFLKIILRKIIIDHFIQFSHFSSDTHSNIEYQNEGVWLSTTDKLYNIVKKVSRIDGHILPFYIACSYCVFNHPALSCKVVYTNAEQRGWCKNEGYGFRNSGIYEKVACISNLRAMIFLGDLYAKVLISGYHELWFGISWDWGKS